MLSKLRMTHFSLAAPGTLDGAPSPLHAGILSLNLEELGFGPPHVVSGEEGLRELDAYGRHHGPLCRVARLFQRLRREREFTETYVTTSHLTHPKRAFEQYKDRAVSDDDPGADPLRGLPGAQQAQQVG